MSRIRFIHASLPDEMPDERRTALRLRRHLLTLRQSRHDPAEPWEEDAALTDADRARIRRRSKALVARARAATGVDHLRDEERDRLTALRDGVRLARIETEHRADEVAATLHAEMPWMARATEVLMHAMRHSARHGTPGFRMPPLLLVGPPGIGKSHWARRLGALIGAPTEIVDATGETASFAVSGLQRGWSTATPGRPLQSILSHGVGNPVIVVDEIEKAGAPRAISGTVHDLTNALLPLLEPSTAVAWRCPAYRVGFDMSWINWVMTANSLAGLAEPLLNRCEVLRLPALSSDDLRGFLHVEGARRGLSPASIGAMDDVLSGQAPRASLSLRTVTRMLDRAERLEARPITH